MKWYYLAMKNYFETFKKSEVTNTKRIITTPSESAKRYLLYVQEAGFLQSLKPHESRRSGLESYLLIYVLSGNGVLQYNGKTFTLGERDCALIDCRLEYSHISSADNPWEIMWIHFNGTAAAQYYHYFAEKTPNVFHVSETSEIPDNIHRIMELSQHYTTESELICASLISNILTGCITNLSLPQNKISPSVSLKLAEIVRYLDAHFMDKITLDALSEHFFISKYYLSREFKQEYGTTIISYVLKKRINYAKELLRYSGKSIEEIGIACGIDDASYFNKVFSKMEGVTASAYRRQWRGRPQ